tara:strand:+ start:15754 stop:16086 length:333 start_codon:yes stop_codon:yes gene_type:complete
MDTFNSFLHEGKKLITYDSEVVASYSGQTNYELGMHINGDIVGMVEYVLFDGELTVSNIMVVPKYRRKGIGSRMMQVVKGNHPDFKYIPSGMTDLGAKFKHKKIKDLYSL